LERYERLILEVAKDIWRRDNRGRRRLPRRFSERLALRLTHVDPGSVVPILERPQEALDIEASDYFDLARDKVDREFEKIVTGAWDDVDLPPSAVQVLKRFGSTLHGRETFTFRAFSSDPIAYTQEVRSRYLAQKVEGAVHLEGFLIGAVHGLDAGARTFRLIAPGGQSISGNYTEPTHFDELRDALSDDTSTFYRLECTYLKTATGVVQAVQDVTEIEIFLSESDPWATRLLEIASLTAGWLDGDGVEIDLSAVELARDILEECSARSIRLPRVYPTPAGGVQLEWHDDDSQTELEITPDLEVIASHFGPDEDVENVMRGSAAAVTFVRGLV